MLKNKTEILNVEKDLVELMGDAVIRINVGNISNLSQFEPLYGKLLSKIILRLLDKFIGFNINDEVYLTESGLTLVSLYNTTNK